MSSGCKLPADVEQNANYVERTCSKLRLQIRYKYGTRQQQLGYYGYYSYNEYCYGYCNNGRTA